MYFDFQFTTHDEDDEWFESLESDNEEIEMGSAVKIQDPISSLGLVPPLMVESGTNMKNALDLLQQKEQNCLLVTENNKLTGILTERDILLKITGKGFDLELAMVDEFMTENPEFLSPEDPLAYALNKMHVGGFRHVPVLNDSMLPVGLISINNVISTIADYFSMEIINLPPLNRLIDSDKQEGG
jgi:CBS domain-containing protein|tara:strand:+ start:616 stop:1170 length:555 start_codon:yes stop_codon:yes gene_type:complete